MLYGCLKFWSGSFTESSRAPLKVFGGFRVDMIIRTVWLFLQMKSSFLWVSL